MTNNAKFFQIKETERFPEILEPDILYYSRRFHMATLLCPCGCRHQVNLLIGDGHTLREDVAGPTVDPSIGVWDANCKSHFWLQNGMINWADKWDDARISDAMEDQQIRHSTDVQKLPWYGRFFEFVRNLFGKK